MIETDSISQSWIESLKLFRNTTLLNRYDSRLGPCVEIENISIKIRSPRQNEDLTRLYPRKFSVVINSYVDGFLNPYNYENSTNSIRLYEWEKGGNKSGNPLNQISRVIEKLISNPDSRHNIVALWDPEIDWDHPNPVAPLMGYFRAKSNRLNSTLIVRSIDAYLGAIPMFLGFIRLHEHIAKEANIRIGPVNFFVLSYHIYEMDLPIIKNIVEDE